MCQGFSHFPGFLHPFDLANIRIRVEYANDEKMTII